MSRSGVLTLRCSKFDLCRFYEVVKICAKHVQNVLYIDFNLDVQADLNVPEQNALTCVEMYEVLDSIYKCRNEELNSLDVRVLLASELQFTTERSLSHRLDVAFLDTLYKNEPSIVEKACMRYNFKHKEAMHFVEGFQKPNVSKDFRRHAREMKTYDTVAVGGTFDRIHNGHRLLLSTSCLLSNSKIVVGVSDEALLVNKTLSELIEPLEVRMRNIAEFIEDIKPGLIKEIVPLSDPAGPTKTDPNIDCLVVSAETLGGGHAVNELRKEAGLPKMELFSVELVGMTESLSNGSKLSSTSGRHEDLGALLRPPRPKSHQLCVYVIGLTGGIASGKSSIAKRLEKLGAEIINADLVGHSVYELGTEGYREVVKSFGDNILNSDGSINRQSLGSIVFSDSDKLRLLNSILWPKIMKKIRERVLEVETRGIKICVVEAALLLEAGWDEVVDEIWVSVIPEAEAIKRMNERNGLSESEAKKRLASQLSNKDRVHQANIVFSTLWEQAYTQKQVEKAWQGLQLRLKEAAKHEN